MNIRVKIDGVSRLCDLERVRCPSQLKAGDVVMIRVPRTREIITARVFSVVQDCVTIEYKFRGSEPEYIMIYARKLWDKVLRLDQISDSSAGRPSKYCGRGDI